MKTIKGIAALLTAITAAQITSFAQTTWNAGDLIVGFRSTDVAETSSFEINVGSVFAIRNGGSFSVNINTQLVSLFGADWFTAGNVSFGAVSSAYSVNTTDTAAPNGDPGRTTYYTQATSTIGFSGDTADTLSTGNRSTINTQILGLINTSSTGSPLTGSFVGQTNLGSNSASLLNTNTNSWAGKTATTTDFGVFGSSNAVDAPINGTTTYVDLYRMLDVTTNAVTPANAQIANTVGTGQFVATLQITSDGTLSTSAIPEPSSYAALAGLAALGLVATRRRRA